MKTKKSNQQLQFKQKKVKYSLRKSIINSLVFLYSVEKLTTKVNSNKKQPIVAKTEVKQTQAPIVDLEIEKIQEDEGPWVTQNNKQVCSNDFFAQENQFPIRLGQQS